MAQTLNNLARLYANQARYATQNRFNQRSLKIREAHLGPSHPLVQIRSAIWRTFIPHKARSTRRRPCTSGAWRLRKRHSVRIILMWPCACTTWPGRRWSRRIQHVPSNTLIAAAALIGIMSVACFLCWRKANSVISSNTPITALGSCTFRGAARSRAGQPQHFGCLGSTARPSRRKHSRNAHLLGRDSHDPKTGELARQLSEIRRQLSALILADAPAGQEHERQKRIDEWTQQEEALSHRLGQDAGGNAPPDP